MSAVLIEELIKHLGSSYNTLVASNIIPPKKLEEAYKGRSRLYMTLQPGLGLDFLSETQTLNSIYLTLIKTTPSTAAYKGQIPIFISSLTSKANVRKELGEPLDSSGPLKMPIPIGDTGGWDAYKIDEKLKLNGRLSFQYNVKLEVCNITFTSS